MFNLNDSMQYFLYPYPTDMRKSFYTLSGIVTNNMGRNVQDGEVFIFINRTCDCMKLLHLECGGLVIYHLKLEAGNFKLPVFDEATNTFHTTWSNLMLMVQGIDPGTCRQRKRWKK
ncbi:transposase [Bacteroidia bacterium]|nr:transposase [Bacteroidia bacterium]GHT84153.1 transposase [Bacteroidia bacterium]GHV70291.1 transposase [Bacteroidia bacterium]